ncbi:NAD(P)-binding domain-containing protein [Nonomuraea sp. NPDC059007]|uniref:NAD(P)-binding domain-containing protein n=1 Tax=Nonomuraea sp. NPDC059007 TaxID=3346692 RepID=UPI00367D9181
MSARLLSLKQRSRTAVILAARCLGTLLPGEATPRRLAKFALVSTCTVLVLLLGASAILLAAGGELGWAGVCILGCFVLDGIDGALARKFGVASPFGAQMDSLADLCGFGVATPLLACYWLTGAAPHYAVVSACAALATCAMIRLARFNVLPKDGRYFAGLPAAMPAVIVAVAIQLGVEPSAGHLMVVGVLAILMITILPYAKIGRILALPWWIWPIAVLVVVASPKAAFGLLVAAYLTSGPVLWALKRASRPRTVPVSRQAPALSPHPHVRIAIIGAGFAGLGVAIRLKQLGIDDFLVFERADDLGGTWRDSVYPGAASDVPSNLYCYSFVPEPGWTRTFPTQPEIQRYLRRCANEHQLDRHLRFGQAMLSSEWDDDAAHWRVGTSKGPLTADVLVVATGPLSEPATPSVPGLERFTGTVFHSAAWDPSHDIRGKRVAVIGTGASAVQFIPGIQPQVAELYVFQRNPPWVMPRWDRDKTVLEKGLFRRLPSVQRLARTAIYLWRESLLLGLAYDQRMLKPAEWLARRHLRRQVDDPELRAALTPNYKLGCKRIILSSSYFPAITQPNTELVTSEIREVRQNSIISADRTERIVDTIIFGTGFERAHTPVAQRIRGRNGRLLTDAWREGAEAYLGTAIAGYPNLFMMLGPNTVSGQNSSLVTMEAQINYAINAVRFMAQADVAAVEVRGEVQSAFVADVQRKMTGTVWVSGCSNWYVDAHGRNTTLWPGFTRTFRRRTRRFDHENYLVRSRSAP